jgi:predicted metal-dependent hydrolase
MYQVLIDDQLIEYSIEYKRIKRVYIRFKDGHFSINAPLLTSRKEIEKMLAESGKQLNRLKKRKPIIKLDLSLGSKIKLINTHYTIDYGFKEMVIGEIIYLKEDNLKASLDRVAKQILFSYVKAAAISYYNKMYNDKNYPTILIKSVKSKLGHYHLAKHQIMINLSMVYNNSDLIDYVIVHELAHIQEFNHQPKFYSLIAKILPNYKQLEKLLKIQGEVV